MSDFGKALIFTVIPIVVLCIMSITLLLTVDVDRPGEVGIGEQIGFGIPALLVIALVAAIIFSVRGLKQVAKGIWIGFGVGLVALILIFIIPELVGVCFWQAALSHA